MKNWKVVAAVGLAFLMGCASVQLAKFVVPPLSANQQDLKKWEYFCFKSSMPLLSSHSISIEDIVKKSNELGAQGWEMVSGGHPVPYCFKREL